MRRRGAPRDDRGGHANTFRKIRQETKKGGGDIDLKPLRENA